MNVLITGGAGFIGSHLVDRLLVDGHRVCVLDHFRNGTGEHRVHGKLDRKLSLHRIDLGNDAAGIKRFFANVDWVFHLAGRSNNSQSQEKPLDYFRVNTTGTIHVLEAARQHGVKRFLYLSSAAVYGIPDTYPTPETAPIELINPHALTKFMGEEAVLHWGVVYKLPVVVLRLFSVYGPKVRRLGGYGSVISRFVENVRTAKTHRIAGDGSLSRDLIHIDDVVEALIRAASSSVSGAVFNVGTGETTSLRTLANLFGGSCIADSAIVPVLPMKTQADIRKIRRVLGWKPTVSITQGITMIRSHL